MFIQGTFLSSISIKTFLYHQNLYNFSVTYKNNTLLSTTTTKPNNIGKIFQVPILHKQIVKFQNIYVNKILNLIISLQVIYILKSNINFNIIL